MCKNSAFWNFCGCDMFILSGLVDDYSELIWYDLKPNIACLVFLLHKVHSDLDCSIHARAWQLISQSVYKPC